MAEAAFDSFEDTLNAFRPGQRFAGDSKLSVRFFLHPVMDQIKSEESGRPIFVEKEYIEIVVPGDKDNTVCRPVRGLPIPDAQRFSRQYQAFKSGLEQSVVGTPLTQWPGITRGQVEELRYFKVTTVEQLAEMPDTAAQNFAGLVTLRNAAKVYLERAAGNAVDVKLQAALAEKDNQIAALSEALTRMTETMQRLEMRMDDSEEKDKKGKK